MDNAQFRNLLTDDKSSNAAIKPSSSSNGFKTPSLGSRARASMPMTPRSVAGYNPSKDLLWQVSEHTRQSNGEPAKKRFKTVAAPRGTKLGQGYQDRTNLRQGSEDAQTGREKKLGDLEEMWKEEKIDRATFEKLRDQMGIGGDIGSTHLVKGLDFKLLERARRGEDLNTTNADGDRLEGNADVDDELDTVLGKEVTAQQKDDREMEHKVVQESSKSEVLTRDDILRRLKSSRSTKPLPPTAPEPDLSDRFKKIPTTNRPEKKKFVEVVNGRRREVLVVTDKQGKIKRKSRWLDPEGAATNTNAAPLGMEVPADISARHKARLEQAMAEEEDDDDIFQGIGVDYDPLKDIESDSDGEANQTETETKHNPQDSVESKPRNYFSAITSDEAPDATTTQPLTKDPTLMAALKRAAAIRRSDEGETQAHDDDRESAPSAKQSAFLQKLKQREREDAQDVDLGFGESRFGDGDDDEDGPIYDGDEGGGEGEKKGGGQQNRKRVPKKRKGDKNNVADVMGVLEGRKK